MNSAGRVDEKGKNWEEKKNQDILCTRTSAL